MKQSIIAALLTAIQGCGGGGDDPSHPDVIVCNTTEDCPIVGPVIERRTDPITPIDRTWAL